MLMKLLVSVFERAKSKITSTRSNDRTCSDSEPECGTNSSKQIFSTAPLIIHQQPRLSLSKWLCTNPSSVDKSIFSIKSRKVRRSSSWRSLKERGNNYIGHFTTRTLSVDELHRNDKVNSTRKQQQHRRDLSHSPVQRSKPPPPPGFHSVRLLPTDSKRLHHCSSKKFDQSSLTRNNTHSGGGDSGYSEDSFITSNISSLKRPLHTSCPHCHCEQRSSFHQYQKSREHFSSDSSSSDTTINKDIPSTDFFYSSLLQTHQSLSASRSYPHIKPLPKSRSSIPRKKSTTNKQQRRRHLSCDSSLWNRTQPQITQTTSPNSVIPLQRHFTTIGMIPNEPHSKNPKPHHDFGELNLAAIELDSVRTFDHSRSSFSSSYSSSSSASINHDKSRSHSHRKRTYLVWHEYQNSSLLSATNGTKIFSVIRGDQVRLLKRIGKSTLLVQKEDDGSIGFLPQSCLAHDQINSFLSVKGLRETVL